jgi:hypothetical protein
LQLDRIQIVLRRRTGWEAIDLGTAMARRWYGLMLRAWLCFVLPLQLLLWALLRDSAWLIYVLWWLKPLTDVVLLATVGRSLFDSPPALRSLGRTVLPLWAKNVFPLFVTQRLGFERSLWLPILQLEGSRGRMFQARRHALRAHEGKAALFLTLSCLLFEAVLVLGGLGFAALMVPEDFLETFVSENSWREVLAALGNVLPGFFILAWGLVAPVYVCGGFAIYLSQRTHLEGWDIELVFRKLAERLRVEQQTPGARGAATRVASLVFWLCVSACALPSHALAGETACTPADPQEVIARVLSRPEFGSKKKVMQWVPKRKGEEESEDTQLPKVSLGLLAEILRILLWAGFGAVLLWLGYWLVRAYLRRAIGVPSTTPPTGSVTSAALEAMAARPPPDPVASARELWTAGNRREAVAMLYRSALHVLERREGVRMPKGATERECMRVVREAVPSKTTYFSSLTGSWISVAYAHGVLDAERFNTLCDGWSGTFGGKT